jgi:two-component system, sensor histidine kinase
MGPHRVNLLALTGLSQVADKDRTLAAGFDAHLVKPTEIDHLLAAMTKSGASG